ncbi:MAG: endonuclease/exonuclease/phosphatase family protein [Alistipes sp.]|nr:endonuclease/exonuclease/phosphatase family protein [Alistipes sp.]
MRKILFALAAVAAFAVAGCTSVAGEQDIRVISYNIRYMNDKDGDNSWKFRKQASINMVNEEQPTVFGLQEAVKAQVDFLQENLPDYGHYGVGRDDGVEKGEFMAIFYKKEAVELLDHGTFWLAATPDTPTKGWDGQCFRTCTWTIFKCKDTGKQFAFLNTHLDHKGKVAQQEGMKTIVNKIGELVPKDMPVFLSGDFNTRTDNPIYEPLKAIMADSRELATETDHRGTYTGWKVRETPVVVDHIFVRGVEVDKFQVLCDKNYGAPYISDHYPVMTTARF